MLLITVMVVQQGSAVVISAEAVPETAAETATEPAAEPPQETQPPETQPPQTEPVTQAPTEPATQAPTEPPQTEPVTQAPTEPATQAPTEPPQTEPTTQAPTEPPQTEPTTQAPTEPPQTEPATQEPTEPPQTEPTTQAPTEPPQTEPTTQEPTEPPQTEPTTQAPTETEQTESETQKTTETERPQTEKPDETEEPAPPAPPVPEFPTESETETETEAQTDVKDRQNDGTRIRVSVVRDGLIDALPYLIVADEATGIEYGDLELAEPDEAAAADLSEPESGQEETEKTEDAQQEGAAAEDVLVGSGASDILDILEGFSLELANGRGTRTVKVVNLYVGEDGGIDDQKLQEALAVKLPNVEDEMAVVNIIASSEDQSLSFSGYDIFDTENAGKVLYNFAAFEYINENKIKFKDYTGTVTLSNGSGLEGTWLAPTAKVNVNSSLSGAVYADTVNVSGGSVLEKVELADDSGEEEELKEETQTDSEESTETSDTEEETEETSETELQTEEDTEEISETEIQTEEGTEETSETELQTEEETEEISETELQTEEETEEISETELLTEEDTEIPETEEDTDLILIDEEEALRADEVSGVDLTMHVLNGSADNTPVAGVAMAVKAAEDITGANGAVLHEKDALITGFESKAEGVQIGSYLTNSGYYYVEMAEEEDSVQTEYLPGTRVYFHVNKQGKIVIGEGQGHPTSLNYYVYQFEGNDSAAVPGGLLIVEAPSGSTFVVKDKEKKVLTDSAGYPSYFITIPGSSAGGEAEQPPVGRAAVTLPAGTYWLSQLTAPEGYMITEDKQVEIKTGETGGQLVVISSSPANAGNSNTLTVSVETLYGKTLLTAEKDMEFYAALFSDEELTQRVTGVQKVTQQSGTTDSGETVFYVQGTRHHYLAETDALGNPVTGYTKSVVDESGKDWSNIKYESASGESLTRVLRRDYSGAYPDGLFSYMADISITTNVQDNLGKEQAVTDEFYISLFRDADHTELEQTVPITLENANTKTVTVRKKMTSGEVSYYAAETDEKGNLTEKIGTGTYIYSSFSIEGMDKEGKFTLICGGEQPKLTVTNTLGKSVIRIRVVDSSGTYLSGAELAIKNPERNLIGIGGTIKYQSASEDIILEIPQKSTGSYIAGTCYLSEIKAPAGYMPVPDTPFTVVPGMTTDVKLINTPARGSGKVTVGVQIYEGTNQLYAQDTSSGQYAAAGSYTRYFALFLDSAYTQKATNVQSLTISGFTGTTTFENLEEGKTYYVAETDQYGRVRGSNTERTISYTDNGRVTALSSNAQVIANENYSTLPQGFRYSARLTIEKRVVDSSDQAKAVSESFYVGIYRNADFSDTPTIVRLDLKNASTASVTRRILLSGTSDVTYYFAEVNANGQRVANSADFKYASSIDKEQVTLTKSADEKIVVTNKDKISKVTLYLTKRVYQGSTLQNVNATFYAGLFRDAQFTELYADPVPLNIQNNSSVTLKLSLNLGAASEATIYVAEVDRNGKVVQSGSSFGYDTRVINSTVHFTQETTEVQSIILNTVAGSASDDDWNDIYSSSENNVGGSSGSYSDYISENGSASSGTASSGSGSGSSSVQTGDDTPWSAYLVLMIVSGAVVIAGGRRRRRIRK